MVTLETASMRPVNSSWSVTCRCTGRLTRTTGGCSARQITSDARTRAHARHTVRERVLMIGSSIGKVGALPSPGQKRICEANTRFRHVQADCPADVSTAPRGGRGAVAETGSFRLPWHGSGVIVGFCNIPPCHPAAPSKPNTAESVEGGNDDYLAG